MLKNSTGTKIKTQKASEALYTSPGWQTMHSLT